MYLVYLHQNGSTELLIKIQITFKHLDYEHFDLNSAIFFIWKNRLKLNVSVDNMNIGFFKI